jgi:hypothetical protein
MGETLKTFFPTDAVTSRPTQPEVFKVIDGQPFTLFDISRAPRQKQFGASTFGYKISAQLGALEDMPLIVEGLYERTRNENPHVRIQIYPDYEASKQAGYTTENYERLKDRILLALKQSTLTITIPSKSNPQVLTISNTTTDVEDAYEFVLDSKDVNFDTNKAVDNWRRIKATLTRKEIGRKPRRKL